MIIAIVILVVIVCISRPPDQRTVVAWIVLSAALVGAIHLMLS